MNVYDFTYPPSPEKAQKHRLASRIFKGTDQQQAQLCQCCGKRIGQAEVETPCNIQPTLLSFIGPGAPLFFLFQRYAIGLLAIMVVMFVGFSVATNIISSDCQSANSCIADTFTLLSIINKQSNTLYLSVQSYISLGFVIAVILFFHFFRYKARQLEEKCDQIINSPSDYSIIFRRLPQNTNQNDILQAIQVYKKELIDQGNTQAQKIKVMKIILSYNLRDYNQTKAKNLEQFLLAVKQDRLKQFKPQELVIPTETSKIAIVVFELQQTKELFMYKPNICQSFLRFFCTACTPLSTITVKGQRIGVERAPQPDQISWQNSGITMKGSICRKLLFGTVAIIILLLGGAAQYALQLLSLSTQDAMIKSLLGIVSSVLVTIFNAVILITLEITTKKERAQTLTEFQTSLMVKTTLAQFFNAGIFVIIAQIAASYQTFTIESSNIVSQISLIMILDAVIPNPTLFFLNYFEIIKRIKRFLIHKNFIIASQKQLNQLYTSPEIDLPSKYAYILKTLWLTGLYSPMIPIVVVIAMIGLIINYFIQKLLFTKCYSMPNTISKMAFQSAVQLLEYFLIAFALGQFIIYAYFYKYQVSQIPIQWTVTIFITIGLALLNSALPMQAINEKILVLEGQSKSELKYAQVQQSFEVTYEMSNPVYKTDRKRKQNAGFHGFYSIKNKPKNEELELTNLMINQSNENRKNVSQPLLKNLQNQDKIEQKQQSEEQQSSDLYSLSVKSPTVIEESQEQQRKAAKQQEQANKSKRPKLSYYNKRQLKSDFHVETVVPLENQQIQTLKFYLRHSGKNGFKNPHKVSQQEKLLRKQQAKKLKKTKDAFFIQKALTNYNFIDIKNIKRKKKWNYQISVQQGIRQEKQQQKKSSSIPRQSVLAIDFKQNNQNVDGSVKDNYKKMLELSIINDNQIERTSNLTTNNKKAVFDSPAKQKQSIYNPLNLSTNYDTFFNDIESMKRTQGRYLNDKYVMSFLGMPFSNLLREKKTVEITPKNKHLYRKSKI